VHGGADINANQHTISRADLDLDADEYANQYSYIDPTDPDEYRYGVSHSHLYLDGYTAPEHEHSYVYADGYFYCYRHEHASGALYHYHGDAADFHTCTCGRPTCQDCERAILSAGDDVCPTCGGTEGCDNWHATSS
jgi:hypothetical protein